MIVRQGDVLLMKVDKLPKDIKTKKTDNNRTVLAYGEVTGHAHAIYTKTVRLYKGENPFEQFLAVVKDSELRHEEHDTINLPAGFYKVIQQREYQPEEIRAVRD